MLSNQVKRIRMSFTFRGTRKEQARTVGLLRSLGEDAQRYVVASALANLDHFGTIGRVFVIREQALQRETVPKDAMRRDVHTHAL